MRRRNSIRKAAMAAISLALVALVGVSNAHVVSAATPTTTLSDLKQKCQTAISNRLTFLSELSGRVSSATVLTAEHRSALNGILSSDTSGLTALNATIGADTTFDQLKTDCQAIVNDYRVYVLVGPQVHLVIAADRIDTIDDKFTSVYGTLQSALQHCPGTPAQCQAAQAALDDLHSKVTQSQAAVAGVAATVLAQRPSGYPGNAATLDTARTSISAAWTDLKGGWKDVEVIRQAFTTS